MANILKLSTRSDDLLYADAPISKVGNAPTGAQAFKRTDDTPASTFVPTPHELCSANSRLPSIDGLVNERRTIGGTAQAEHYISELYSASQINRGPEGFCPSSRLHFDMLLGRDEAIGHGDYLNYASRQI